MKRGFLNSKKAKGSSKPLYDVDDGAPTAVAPPRQLDDGASTSVFRVSKKAVGTKVMGSSISNPAPSYLEPYKVFRVPATKSNKPSSTCILRQSTYTTLTSSPDFYKPLPPLDPTDVVFTKDTPKMGVGLFAKRNLKAEQVVFLERPLLIYPSGLSFLSNRLSEEEVNKSHASLFDKELQKALIVMTKEDINAYMGLSNSIPNSPQMYGIARTNGFGANIEEENLAEGKCGYAVIGKLASRINHSCMPNVQVAFDITTFVLRVIAMRNIKAGEQLFNSYCQVDQSVKERRRQLAPYGFICQCKACVGAPPESDKLRENLEDRLRKIVDEREEMFANPRFSCRSLDPLLKLEKDIVKEGLDFGYKFVDLLVVIFDAYGKFHNIQKKMEYFSKIERYTGQTN